jgi:peptidoglycan/LPS O-acetylase OafA/YrhL
MLAVTPEPSNYRLPHSPEIQGLRALAVLAVVLYHIDGSLLPGGFVGVDLFFVISGLLIGRKLLSELDESGTVNLLRFTASRVRRLLPNALIVLVVTGALSVFLIPAYRIDAISYDIRSALLLYSNFHFSQSAVDYLRLDEPPSPLMHFWSLSIEEQFYIILPIAFILIGKAEPRSRIGNAIIAIALITVASFASGLLTLEDSQPAAFFETQNRVWQLTVGVVCGWLAAQPKIRLRLTRRPVLWLALLCASIISIALSMMFMGGASKYPGWFALLPTLGASGLLLALSTGSLGCLTRVLTAKSAMWIGDRSYSIYLWHWPFLSITATVYPEVPLAEWVAAGLAIAAACLAYSWVEQPIRRTKICFRKTLSLTVAGGSLVFGFAIALQHIPLPEDTEARAAEVVLARDDVGGAYASRCHLSMNETRSPPCEFGNTVSSKTVMLWGDSHAAQWFDPLQKASEDAGWRFISRTKTSCPYAEVQIWYPPNKSVYEECSVWRRTVLAEIEAAPPDVLILASYSNYGGWIAEDGVPVSEQKAAQLWKAAFFDTIQKIPNETEIWVVRDNPRMQRDLSRCLSFSDLCGRPREEALRRLVDESNIVVSNGRIEGLIDFTEILCTARYCPAILDGRIVYQDSHHLRASFTKSFSSEFKMVLK